MPKLWSKYLHKCFKLVTEIVACRTLQYQKIGGIGKNQQVLFESVESVRIGKNR